ncbi:MAG: NAD(P)H-hydrate epimerase, partial [Bradyrhizobium sp.]|nr:NAD(P)H-hydrate epimerase [Bradyrhizobium sp.]
MEVLTTTEMERADRLTITAGTPGFALMMSAGQAVAEAAMGLVEEGPIMVVAGRGNNGGDGFVAAAELAARGRDVSVILLCERDSLHGDAALAARGWGDPLEMIEAINANGAPVLAVDLPSGINGTTGAVMGAAINAVETVTFFRRKPAHLLMPGRKHCGRVRVADIGIDPRVLEEIRPHTFENVPQSWQKFFPVPDIDGHKYARGHALVLSGELASTGAARLAARGALRAGAGLVTVASPRDALVVNAAA